MTVSYRIFPAVVIGEGSIIEDYCIIGAPPRGKRAGELDTMIGNGAVLNDVEKALLIDYLALTYGE